MVLEILSARVKQGNQFHQIRRVRASAWGFRKWGIDIYHCRYNSFSDPMAYKRFLERLEDLLQDELQRLPERMKIEANRLVYLRTIIKHLAALRETIRRDFSNHCKPTFTYQYAGGEEKLLVFPSSYKNSLWPTRRDFAHHKICWMHQAHLDFIDHCTIHALRSLGSESGASTADIPPELAERSDVAIPQLRAATSGPLPVQPQDRIQTNLTVKELALLNLVTMEVLTQGHKTNRKTIARLVASWFATKGSNAPSESLVYTSFYERDEKTLDAVKEVLIAALERIRQE